MLKKISIAVMGAALAAAFVGTFTWPGEAQPRTTNAQQARVATEAPEFSRHYDAGMRIIHVPQPGATVARYHDEPPVTDDEIEAPQPPPRHRAVAPQPRRVLPPAKSPKRTMLNAPNSIHDGPTPIRPTPRWRTIEKFTELPKRVTAAPPVADPVTAAIPAQPDTPGKAAAPASDPDIPAIDDDAPPPAELPPTQ